MVIGITGNSGTGKSEIAKLLAKKINAKIISADLVAKKLSEPGKIYNEKIINLFGKEISENGIINRKKLANLVYNNSEKREKLNLLTYIYVGNEIKQEVEKSEYKNVIIDAPLLFESGLDKICNYTIAILAENDIKKERICKRDNIEENTAKARLSIQPEDEYYEKRANHIIKNNGKIEEIKLEEICTKIGTN